MQLRKVHSTLNHPCMLSAFELPLMQLAEVVWVIKQLSGCILFYYTRSSIAVAIDRDHFLPQNVISSMQMYDICGESPKCLLIVFIYSLNCQGSVCICSLKVSLHYIDWRAADRIQSLCFT